VTTAGGSVDPYPLGAASFAIRQPRGGNGLGPVQRPRRHCRYVYIAGRLFRLFPLVWPAIAPVFFSFCRPSPSRSGHVRTRITGA
jgi:hypothetical protein